MDGVLGDVDEVPGPGVEAFLATRSELHPIGAVDHVDSASYSPWWCQPEIVPASVVT